jgi:SAM-dependent methyltransferase
MIIMQNIANEPLNHLDYFVEWGGKKWETLVRYAIQDFLGKSLVNNAVLDIGTRYGKMTCLFALLGASATGIDIREEFIEAAEQEAKKLKVAGRTKFLTYSGKLDLFPEGIFDVVFTKSVLVVVPDLYNYLSQIRRVLKPKSKIVFIENGKGNTLIQGLRVLKHAKYNFTKTRYFTNKEIAMISSLFKVKIVKKTVFPPIYLVLGEK